MAKQTFVASTVLTAAQMNALQANDYNQTVSTKTASYTLVAADAGTRIVMNSASATTITVNTSLFSAGDTLFLQNIGAGVCTVTAGSATVSSAGPLAIPQNGSGTLYFTSAGVSIYYPSAVTATASGLILISTTSFTTQATVDITAFSATYDNYKVIVQTTAGTDDLFFRLGVGGVFNSTANNYRWNLQYATYTSSTITGAASSTTATGFNVGNALGLATSFEVYNPFATALTAYTFLSTRNDYGFMAGGGAMTVTTSYSQMRFYATSGNITGTVSVYGYAK